MQDRYSSVAKLLHWLIAALILANIVLGWNLDDGPGGPRTYAIFQLHKSLGISVLLLSLVRIGWRIVHPPPRLSETLKPWERRLAQGVHRGFYVLMLGLPLTGWLIVSTSPVRVRTMLFATVPWPHIPVADAVRETVLDVAELGHHLFVYIAYALIALHVAGALKHHFLDRDGELGRMFPGPRRTSLFDPRLLLLAVALAGLGAAAATYPWRTMAKAVPAPPPVAEAAPESMEPRPEAAVSPPPPASEAEPAENEVQAQSETEAVEPADWTVDRKASKLGFRAAWNGAAVEGGFAIWEADIRFDPAALDRSKVDVEIDLASVTAADPSVASALPGGDWFDVAREPEGRFTARSFRARGGDRYEARGTLSLRGRRQPVTLAFTLRIEGDKARMSGAATLRRSEFGVGQGEWAATDQVADAVTVIVELVATRG